MREEKISRSDCSQCQSGDGPCLRFISHNNQITVQCQHTFPNDNMKFSHNYHRRQIPEWTSSYVPYPALSRQLKRIAREATLQHTEPAVDG